MTASVTGSQGNSRRGIHFLIVAPVYENARFILRIEKRGITSLGCEDCMTLCNAVWTSPWLPSVGSMCYIIFFQGYENRDKGQSGLLPLGLSQTWRAHWLGLALPNFSSQADARNASFGSEVTFFLLPTMCDCSFLHPVYQPLPEEASMHVGAKRVLG